MNFFKNWPINKLVFVIIDERLFKKILNRNLGLFLSSEKNKKKD